MFRSGLAALLTILAVVPACKKESARPPQESTTDAGDGGFSALPIPEDDGGSSKALAAPERPTEHTPPKNECTRAAFKDGLREGRKAFAENRYGDAVSAFERAVKARPVDAQARGELGYAQLYAGQLDDADGNLRVGAELAAGDPRLAAQIWFNRGLVAEKRAASELARASFAVSDQLHSTLATRAKLKDRSKCPVAVERAAPTVEKLVIVSGWKSVHAKLMQRIMGGEDGEKEKAKPAPATEAEAKRRACVSYVLNEKAEGDPCDGPGPWEIQTGHLMFRDFITDVIPLDGGRFALVDFIRGGGGPASGWVGGKRILAGNRLLVIASMGEAHFVSREGGCITDDLDPALLDAGGIGYGDVRSLTSNDFVVYDTTSGKAVVTGVVWGENAADSLKLSPTELTVAEGESTKGCASTATKL